jgi:hypothetical protein
MKYLALPFVIALGLIEFVLRVVGVLVLCLSLVGLYPLGEVEDYDALFRPVCFKLAERIVA